VPVFSYQFCDQLTDVHKNLGGNVIGGEANFSIFNFLHSVIKNSEMHTRQ